jgi:acyl-CoA dehydrogenase
MVDSIFEVFVRDFSAYALGLFSKASSTSAQQDWALNVLRKPVVDEQRTARLHDEVMSYAGAFEMSP